ncbi:MAG: hypothetical protein AAGA54_21025 [Myxococcota bacterium]
MSSDAELQQAIDALYRGPREAFVVERNALAQRLKTQGRLAQADEVRALPKPSVSAWAVNQLWWHHRPAYDALHEAGAALVALQQAGASVAGQQPNEARRAAIATLRAQAETVLSGAGHAVTAATLRKVTRSLEASAAGGSFGGDGQLGRLHTELAPPGFGQIAQFGVPAVTQELPADPPALVRARKRLDQATLDHDRATREAEDAQQVLAATTSSVADAQAALRRAQETLAEAEAARTSAVARAKAAVVRNQETRASLEAAQRALEDEETPASG